MARARDLADDGAKGGRRTSRRVAVERTPRGRDLGFLLHASEELTRSLELPDVLSGLSRSLLQVVPASRAGVLLRETAPNGATVLRIAAGSLRGGEDVPRGRLLELER